MGLWGAYDNMNLIMFPIDVFVYAQLQVLSDSFSTSWTVAHQAPLSMGFPRQEYWSGLLFSSPGDIPSPGMEPESPAWQADSLSLSHLGSLIPSY